MNVFWGMGGGGGLGRQKIDRILRMGGGKRWNRKRKKNIGIHGEDAGKEKEDEKIAKMM